MLDEEVWEATQEHFSTAMRQSGWLLEILRREIFTKFCDINNKSIQDWNWLFFSLLSDICDVKQINLIFNLQNWLRIRNEQKNNVKCTTKSTNIVNLEDSIKKYFYWKKYKSIKIDFSNIFPTLPLNYLSTTRKIIQYQK